MSRPAALPETLHASCVTLGGQAVLISGPSGSGKSDLSLRLIDRGGSLVSDDYTIVRGSNGRLIASAPPNIAGKMEVRSIGIVEIPFIAEAEVALMVDLGGEVQRMPHQNETVTIAGVTIPVVALNGLEPSAPVKVEVALATLGLPSS